MNIVLLSSQFKKEHVYFTDPIENTVMEDSKFIKILYSNQDVVLNGVFIDVKLKITQKENYFKKIKYIFDVNINNKMLQSIYTIENDILNHYNLSKQKKYIIRDSISNGAMKIFPNSENEANNNGTFILKISGIWENSTEYGVTYKIVAV
tara:strand:+ start:424 stop:873 length:450 start_codon:yes stop_codon:yes gene_type:complete